MEILGQIVKMDEYYYFVHLSNRFRLYFHIPNIFIVYVEHYFMITFLVPSCLLGSCC